MSGPIFDIKRGQRLSKTIDDLEEAIGRLATVIEVLASAVAEDLPPERARIFMADVAHVLGEET